MEEGHTISERGAKLDQDFLLYLSFVKTHFNNIVNETDKAKCQKWLEKLCANQANGFEAKQTRNIFLGQLLQCMQDKNFHRIFLDWPPEGKLPDPQLTFDPQQPNVPEIGTLSRSENDDLTDGFSADGRTYFATKKLPHERGLCAYLAVSLADNEPKWIAQEILKRHNLLNSEINIFSQEFESTLDSFENQFRQEGFPLSPENKLTVSRQLESLLANIDSALIGGQNIGHELMPFYEAFVKDIRISPHWAELSKLSPEDLKGFILERIREKIKLRNIKVLELLPPTTHFLQRTSDTLWEEAAKRGPSQENIELLQSAYSHLLIEKFLNLMAIERAEIVQRCKISHEKTVDEMRNEIKQELKSGSNKYLEVKKNWNQSKKALKLLEEVKLQQFDEESEKHLYEKNIEVEIMAELVNAENRFEIAVIQKAKLNKEISEEIERFEATSALNNSSIEQLNEDTDQIKNEIDSIQNEIGQQQTRLDMMQARLTAKPLPTTHLARVLAIEERETEKTSTIEKKLTPFSGSKNYRK